MYRNLALSSRLAVVLSLGVAGCSPLYELPAGASSASLEVNFGRLAKGEIDLWLYRGDHCSPQEGSGRLRHMDALGAQTRFAIPAETPIVLRVTHSQMRGGDIPMRPTDLVFALRNYDWRTYGVCTRLFGITPKRGAIYTLDVQSQTGALTCAIALRESSPDEPKEAVAIRPLEATPECSPGR